MKLINNNKGHALSELLMVLFFVLSLSMYVGNMMRFFSCDFKPSYKEEIIYGAGLITPTFYVSFWMDIK